VTYLLIYLVEWSNGLIDLCLGLVVVYFHIGAQHVKDLGNIGGGLVVLVNGSTAIAMRNGTIFFPPNLHMLHKPLRLIAVRVDFTLSFGCFTCAGVSEEKNALVKSAIWSLSYQEKKHAATFSFHRWR